MLLKTIGYKSEDAQLVLKWNKVHFRIKYLETIDNWLKFNSTSCTSSILQSSQFPFLAPIFTFNQFFQVIFFVLFLISSRNLFYPHLLWGHVFKYACHAVIVLSEAVYCVFHVRFLQWYSVHVYSCCFTRVHLIRFVVHFITYFSVGHRWLLNKSLIYGKRLLKCFYNLEIDFISCRVLNTVKHCCSCCCKNFVSSKKLFSFIIMKKPHFRDCSNQKSDHIVVITLFIFFHNILGVFFTLIIWKLVSYSIVEE